MQETFMCFSLFFSNVEACNGYEALQFAIQCPGHFIIFFFISAKRGLYLYKTKRQTFLEKKTKMPKLKLCNNVMSLKSWNH